MTPDQPDRVHRALAELDARLGRITAELADVRAGLSDLARQSAAAPGPARGETPAAVWGPGPGPAPGPATGETPSSVWGPGPAPASGPWRPAAHAAAPGRPAPGQQQPWRPGVGPAPEAAGSSPRSRGIKINAATIIAAIGGAVMLAGVAFLLVVAIQAGLFPPIARVIGAAVLAAVLLGLGLWLQARHEPTDARPVNPGALALVGTGLAAGMLDVIASTVLYQWVPMPAAYLFVGGLALGGIALAHRWSSAVLACLVTAGTMALSPLISSGVELPIFYAIIGIATAVLAGELGTVVRVLWSVPPAFLLTGYLANSGTTATSDVIALVVAALAFAAVAVVVAWYDTFRRSPVNETASLVVVPTAVPLLVIPTLDLARPGLVVGLVLAAAYLVIAVLVGRVAMAGAGLGALTEASAPADARSASDSAAPVGPGARFEADARHGAGMVLAAVAGCVGSVLLVAAWIRLEGDGSTALAITLTAVAYVLVAGQWARAWVEWVAGITAVLALLVYLVVNQPHLALSERLAVREFTYLDVVASFAIGILAVAATWWIRRRHPSEATRAMMAGAVVALAALSVMVVAAGVVIGGLSGFARNGFLAAHLVVTVLWICCAAWLVLTASPRFAEARTLGFVLGGLALAKLLFLDLATLPGLFRVLSFIVVGAVMLAVAVRYRRDTDPSGSGSPT